MDAVHRHRFSGLLPGLLALVVLAVGVAASVLAWEHSRQRERSLVENAFQAEAVRLVAVIERQLNTYKVVMRGLQGFFQGSREVDYQEFLAYTRALHATSDVAGLQGIAWVEVVRREQLAAHSASISSQLPVYTAGGVPETVVSRREQIVGFVDIPFRVVDLMAGLRSEINPALDLDI